MIRVHHSDALMLHLETFEDDGATVASLLFDGGRLSYPERQHMEYQLGFSEPYTLYHEARVMTGMGPQWNAACRFLARLATRKSAGHDPTLDLLWTAHDAFSHLSNPAEDPALDRLIAALVTIHDARKLERRDGTGAGTLVRAGEILIRGLHSQGFPPSSAALEELCDGAMPACVGLGMIDIDWRTG